MNDKIRNILHTAWTEPRHFFLWLALLSLCGFAAVAAIVSSRGLWSHSLTLAWLALIFTAGFVLSVVAFVLAWIPPVRRWLGWLLARRVVALICLVTLVALIYAFGNWRGRSAWLNYKHQREAQGEQLDLAGLVPPPVPREQNFFETPLWNGLHFVRSNNVVVWADTNWGNHVFFDAFGPNGNHAPSPGNWAKAQRVDLTSWQAFYRSTNNVFAAPDGTTTNYFPVAPQPQSPAADVLLALSRFETNRQLLIQAAARPQARFWVNYEAGPAMLLPHLARVKGSVQYLAFQANAALKAGDRATATENMKLLFRLLESIRAEPLLISQLVRIASAQIILQPIWEGLADHQWTQADLQLLENDLAQLDFLADYQTAMRGEQACNLWAIDYVRENGLAGWDRLTEWDSAATVPREFERFVAGALFQLIPSGWFDQNKLASCRLHQEYVLPMVDPQRRVVSPEQVRKAQTALVQRHWGLNEALAKMLFPSFSKAAERFARGQSAVDLARVACALEQYRLAKGQYPEKLQALTPQFLEKLPSDLIDGQPLKYQRTPDGQFVLYSVGWNQTDDGGKIAFTKSGAQDPNRGDWVWRYPAG